MPVQHQRLAHFKTMLSAWFSHRQRTQIVIVVTLFALLFSSLAVFVNLTHAQSPRPNALDHGKPHTYQAPKVLQGGKHPGPQPLISGKPNAKIDTTLHHIFKPSMQPLMMQLVGVAGAGEFARAVPQAAHALSSDGLLEVSVPATALSTGDIAAHGTIQLVVDQIAPPSGSTDGGADNGTISFGTYLFQIQGSNGHELANGGGLHQPITVIFHAPGKRSPVPLSRIVFDVNPALPVTLPRPAQHFGSHQAVKTTFDAKTNTITGIVPMTASSTGGGFSTNAPVGYFSNPNGFQNDLHTGSLNDTVGIDVPSGPGGLTPPIQLSYSSNAMSETHGPQAAAPWVGMGWNLDQGQISWSESIDPVLANGSDKGWRSSWHISDPFGTSDDLIPPVTTVDTFYDDTLNNPATTPQVWHTATENFAKIISYTNPVTNSYFPVWNGSAGYHVQPPCYRVWLTNGIMEEFGCTPDSLQWYPNSTSKGAPGTGTTNYVTAWKLDLITDPSGNQIHLHYWQDMVTAAGGNTYPRDVVLANISWDSPGCLSATTYCPESGGGATWNPLMKVVFNHSTTATAASGASTCAANGSLRCDDPVAQTFPNIGTPLITSTQVLNSIQVQVYASSAWNTLRTYTLKYDQGALSPNSITDPFSGHSESAAGWLTLDQVTETGSDGTTYPTQTFHYSIPSGSQQTYLDSNYYPASGAGCGFSSNSGNRPSGNSGCVLWSRVYAGFYMDSADNGLGLHQTFSWLNYHTNTHGVTAGHNALDPAYCSGQSTSEQQSYPCDLADDNGWSHMTLTQRDATTNGLTSTWKYNYDLAQTTAQMCSDCQQGMYWGNANDGDAGDFYNGKFTGYYFTEVTKPDSALEDHYYYTTEGWGVWSTGVTCKNTILPGPSCPVSAAWDLTNAASGREFHTILYDIYNGSSYPKLKEALTTYAAVCPPTGMTSGNTSWNRNFVSEVDGDNPVAVCDVQTTKSEAYTYDQSDNANKPHLTTTYTYNQYGQVIDATATSNNGGATSSPTTINQHHAYTWNDAISTTGSMPTGTYIVDRLSSWDTEDSPSTQHTACGDVRYDGQTSPQFGQTSSLTKGLATVSDTYTGCGNAGNGYSSSGQIQTSAAYDSYGNAIASVDPEGNAGNATHKATTGACTGYTVCTTLDSTFHTLPVASANAANQITTTGYNPSNQAGFGLWPVSATDPNNRTSSVAHDGLGRIINTTATGETNGTTTQTAYLVSCNATGAQNPCLEVDHTQRLHDTVVVTSADYYDGWGQHVESRSPAPNGKDVIVYARYDTSDRMVFQSLPYYVTHGTGYLTPDVSKTGTQTDYDGLDRAVRVTDPLSHVATTIYAMACGWVNDAACYEHVASIDANAHQQDVAFFDAFGRKIYDQTFTGANNNYTAYQTYKYTYNYNGNLIKTVQPDGTSQTTATFDAAGRMTAATDPDLGSYTYTYDHNGNEKSSVDPRGVAGTVYLGYDGLNRNTWVANTSNGSSPFASYTYDSGVNGVGRLTGESFASGPSQSITGSYAYTYDNRGQQTKKVITIAGTGKTFQKQFNDAGQQTQLTYSDGSTLTTAIDDSSGWTSGSTAITGGTTYSLLNALQYSDASNFGGPAGHMTQASIGNGTYTGTWHYDGQLRLDEGKIVTGSTTLFDEQRGFDAVSNIVTKATTIPQGTVNQTFCYDDRNRIVWAGSTGTPSCGTPAPTGTFTNAQYSQSYTYDTLDRMTSGLKGSASFGNGTSQPLHAITSSTGGYTALYDAAGQLTCRAPSSSQTCSPTTQTGQTLSYDALNRLTAWQNQPAAPTSTDQFAYDGSGERVWQQSVVSGTTTTTSYYGGLEEVIGTTTTHYFAAGPVTLETKGSTVSYLVNDGLGSVSLNLSTTGTVLADALFKPFGVNLYHTSTMPTALGFTGQYGDAVTGLDYYGARYYDPNVGQFTTADTVQGPNRYGYVGWNPETLTDPTGHDADPCFGLSPLNCLRFYYSIAVFAMNSLAGGYNATIEPPIMDNPIVRVITSQPVTPDPNVELPGDQNEHPKPPTPQDPTTSGSNGDKPPSSGGNNNSASPKTSTYNKNADKQSKKDRANNPDRKHGLIRVYDPLHVFQINTAVQERAVPSWVSVTTVATSTAWPGTPDDPSWSRWIETYLLGNPVVRPVLAAGVVGVGGAAILSSGSSGGAFDRLVLR